MTLYEAHRIRERSKMISMRFERPVGNIDGAPVEFGPYEWVQLTYNVIRISPDGDEFAVLKDHPLRRVVDVLRSCAKGASDSGGVIGCSDDALNSWANEIEQSVTIQSKDAVSEPLCEHPVTVTSETPNGICGKPHAYQWHTDSPVGNVLSAWDHPFMPPPKHAEQAENDKTFTTAQCEQAAREALKDYNRDGAYAMAAYKMAVLLGFRDADEA